MAKIVFGLMDSMSDAREAMEDLASNGFDRENIGIDTQEGQEDLSNQLTSIGVPERQSRNYAEGVRRGGYLIHVQTDEAEAPRAAEIIDRHGPIDIEKRAEEWRESEERLAGEAAEPEMPSEIARKREGMPLAEEEIRIGKRQKEEGEVRARTSVKETPIEEEVTLRNSGPRSSAGPSTGRCRPPSRRRPFRKGLSRSPRPPRNRSFPKRPG